MKQKKEDTEKYTLYGFNFSFLTESEKKVIGVMKSGHPLLSEKEIKQAILDWVDLCVQKRIASN